MLFWSFRKIWWSVVSRRGWEKHATHILTLQGPNLVISALISLSVSDSKQATTTLPRPLYLSQQLSDTTASETKPCSWCCVIFFRHRTLLLCDIFLVLYLLTRYLAISIMTLLEVIKGASINSKSLDLPSDYPVVLNPDRVIPNLKSELKDEPLSSPIKPLIGWEISQTDTEIIGINKKFFTELKIKVKNTNNLQKDAFIFSLNSYLENIREKVGFSIEIDLSGSGYSSILIDKLGCFMGKDVAALVLDGCVSLEIWELVEALIVNGVIENTCYSILITRLVEKKRSDLLCLCIKHAFDLGSSEIFSILRYFLSPSKDAYKSMVSVKKEWENQALLAIEKASDSNLKRKNLLFAKEASILLMMGYDGFSASELCLHYLIASSNINDVLLSPAFNKLDGKELLNLIHYLAKWLKKYERFPQAGPCPKASSVLGLKACDWVPKLEDVGKCLGLVLDENFSSLVLHPQFHEELRSIEGVVSCLTAEAKLCYMMTDVVTNCRSR